MTRRCASREFPTFASVQHFGGVLAMARGEIEAARARFHRAGAGASAGRRGAILHCDVAGWAVDERVIRLFPLEKKPCCSAVALVLSRRPDI